MQWNLLFWILMLAYLGIKLWGAVPLSGEKAKAGLTDVLLFVLLVMLGWKAYGPAVHGP